MGAAASHDKRGLLAVRESLAMQQPTTMDRAGRRLDLLFCLAWLEAQRAATGPVLALYDDLLVALREIREGLGTGWYNAVAPGSEASNALAWISRTCQSQLVSIEPGDCPSGFCWPRGATLPAQLFLVQSGPPARERRFDELRSKYGSSYAFHGSAPGNWASILRHGLRSLSHTDRMANGAVHGSGVYLSPTVTLAAAYSGLECRGRGSSGDAGRTPTSSISVAGDSVGSIPRATMPAPENLRILALCEVATMPAPGLKRTKLRVGGAQGLAEVWVAEEDGLVAMRLLLVFREPTAWALPVAEDLAAALPTFRAACSRVQPAAALLSVPGPRSSVPAESFPVTSVTIPTWSLSSRGTCRKQRRFFHVEARCGNGNCGGSVMRRFADFIALRERVGDGPQARFPRRHALASACRCISERQLEKQRQGLEAWLREIVAAARRGLLQAELHGELCAFLGTWGPV